MRSGSTLWTSCGDYVGSLEPVRIASEGRSATGASVSQSKRQHQRDNYQRGESCCTAHPAGPREPTAVEVTSPKYQEPYSVGVSGVSSGSSEIRLRNRLFEKIRGPNQDHHGQWDDHGEGLPNVVTGEVTRAK